MGIKAASPLIPSPAGDLCTTGSTDGGSYFHVTLSEAEGSGLDGRGVVGLPAGDSSLRSE